MKETCEDLAEANQRLLSASDFYTNTPQSPHVTNTSPSIHTNSNHISPIQPRTQQTHTTRPVPTNRVIKSAIPHHSDGLKSKSKAPVMSMDYVVFGDHPEEQFNTKEHHDFTFMTSNNNNFDM